MRSPFRALAALALGLSVACGPAPLDVDGSASDAGADARALDDAPPDAWVEPADAGSDAPALDAPTAPAGPLRPGVFRLVDRGARRPVFVWSGPRLTMAFGETLVGVPRILSFDATGVETSRIELGAVPRIGPPTHIPGIDSDGVAYGAIVSRPPTITGREHASGLIGLDGAAAATWTPRPTTEIVFSLTALPLTHRWAMTAWPTAPMGLGTTSPMYPPVDLVVLTEDGVPAGTTELATVSTGSALARNGGTALAVWFDISAVLGVCGARAIGADGTPAPAAFSFGCGSGELSVVAHGAGYATSSAHLYGPIVVSLLDPALGASTTETMLPVPAGRLMIRAVAVAGDATGARLAVTFFSATSTGAAGQDELWTQVLDATTLSAIGEPIAIAALALGQRAQGLTSVWTSAGLLVAWTDGPIDGPVSTFVTLLEPA